MAHYIRRVVSPGNVSGVQRRALQSQIFDAVLALACAVLSMLLAVPLMDRADDRWRVIVIALALVHTLCLAARRVAPMTVFLVNLATALAVVALGMPTVILHLTPLIALYSVASQTPRDRALWAGMLALGGLAATQVLADDPADLGTVIGNGVAIGAVWLVGTVVRTRQEYVRRLEERTKELQEAREELAQTAVAAERLRVARELHDVVAHSLSMIAVQSGVGGHVLDEQPEEARRALKSIEDVSREALNEMRRMLGVLRDEGGQGLAPTPGIDNVGDLLERVEKSGVKSSLQVHGVKRPLSPGLDLTAYRIVQESLTNVIKHSNARNVRVTVTYDAASVSLEIVDDGVAGAGSSSTGMGLAGMRERVALFGGSLETGPLEEGGFRVRADLATEEVAS